MQFTKSVQVQNIRTPCSPAFIYTTICGNIYDLHTLPVSHKIETCINIVDYITVTEDSSLLYKKNIWRKPKNFVEYL